MMPERRAWDRHAIREEVWRRGSTLNKIDKAYGLTPSSARVALHRPNKAGERALSDFLGVSVDELFRYRTSPANGSAATNAESSRNGRPVSTSIAERAT
jgi:Ner family transcriptional regulator